MSGIQMALLGASSGTVVIVGQYSFTFGSTTYYYGYDNSTGFVLGNFGDIDNDTFSGATIKGIFSTSPPNSLGQAIQYTVYFDGNRSAGFFNTLTVNGTLVTGALGAPNYNAGNNETSFAISVSAAPTLFGITDLVRIPTILT